MVSNAFDSFSIIMAHANRRRILGLLAFALLGEQQFSDVSAKKKKKCRKNKKKCGKKCIPKDNCCSQKDCPVGMTCIKGACKGICIPRCQGRICGPDGCGGQCGIPCSGRRQICNDEGRCVCPQGLKFCPDTNDCDECCSNAECRQFEVCASDNGEPDHCVCVNPTKQCAGTCLNPACPDTACGAQCNPTAPNCCAPLTCQPDSQVTFSCWP